MKRLFAAICLTGMFLSAVSYAWDPGELEQRKEDARIARQRLLETSPDMQRFFDAAVGYVVLPNVAKGAIGIGGARGTGLLYEGGTVSAQVTMTQLSIGFQAGGQAYSEFIFFEDAATLAKFMEGDFEVSAQASAVAIVVGASVDAPYKNGMAIFTMTKGGLMYEASVAGQKFKIESVK